MNKPPAYQHYPKDHAAKEPVKMMDLRSEGAYLRLRDHQWENGSIPASLADLALICRVPRAQMARVWPQVAPCFVEIGPGRLADPDLERQRQRLESFRQERSEAGRRGAHSRHGSAIAQPLAQPIKKDGSAKQEPVAKPSSPFASATAPSTEDSQTARAGEREGPPPTTATTPPPSGPPSPCRHPLLEGRMTPGRTVVCPDCGEEFRGKRNPFVAAGGRDKWELEALRLVEQIATLTGEDGPEIMAKAAHYAGAPPGRVKCNPATMGEDRLVNTVMDLRATLKAEQDKRKGAV